MNKFIFDLQRFAEIRYTTTDGTSHTIDIGGDTSIMASTFTNAGVGMTKLKTVEIPYGVNTIVDAAFNNCSSLTTIELPESL